MVWLMEACLHAVVDQLLGLRFDAQSLSSLSHDDLQTLNELLPQLAVSSDSQLLTHTSLNSSITSAIPAVKKARQSELSEYFFQDLLRRRSSETLKDFDWSVRVVVGSDSAAKIHEQRVMLSFTTIDINYKSAFRFLTSKQLNLCGRLQRETAPA